MRNSLHVHLNSKCFFFSFSQLKTPRRRLEVRALQNANQRMQSELQKFESTDFQDWSISICQVPSIAALDWFGIEPVVLLEEWFGMVYPWFWIGLEWPSHRARSKPPIGGKLIGTRAVSLWIGPVVQQRSATWT